MNWADLVVHIYKNTWHVPQQAETCRRTVSCLVSVYPLGFRPCINYPLRRRTIRKLVSTAPSYFASPDDGSGEITLFRHPFRALPAFPRLELPQGFTLTQTRASTQRQDVFGVVVPLLTLIEVSYLAPKRRAGMSQELGAYFPG